MFLEGVGDAAAEERNQTTSSCADKPSEIVLSDPPRPIEFLLHHCLVGQVSTAQHPVLSRHVTDKATDILRHRQYR